MILLTNSKIETEILNHFEENIELEKQDYECIFNFDGAEITVPYYPFDNPIYKNSEIGANDGVSYSIEDTKHFKIRRMETNNYIPIKSEESEYSKEHDLKRPKAKTFQQEIDLIKEREEHKQEENQKSSDAIREHNEYMDLNNR